MGQVIDMFTRKEILSPKVRAYLEHRVAELAVDIMVLQSEHDQIKARLDE